MIFKNYLKKPIAGVLTFALCAGTAFTGLTPDFAEAAPRFNDISGHWGESSIVYAADMGMVKGDDKGYYHPNSNITRAEFVSILNNIFGATEKADISMFYDADPQRWHYENLQIAYFMETIWGMADGRLGADDPIIREDAIVAIARAIELSLDNTSILDSYLDGDEVTDDAKKSVAAMISAGYINGYPVADGKNIYLAIAPEEYLSRAEVAAIITNMITEVYVDGKNYAGRIIGKCMVINTPGAALKGVTINGDLIVGDGVDSVGVTIENCDINGRLIIRGGGEYSIYLTNSTVKGGTFVNSPSVGVRIVGDGYAQPGIVTAKTNTILEGDGFVSLRIPNSARENSIFNISNALIESIDVNAPRVSINLASSAEVTNLRFSNKSARSTLNMSSGSHVGYLGVNAGNITVLGNGSIGEAQINAGGFVCDFTPSIYNIANNMSAVFNGKTRSGGNFSTIGQNEVIRDDYMKVEVITTTPNAFNTSMTTSTNSNSAYLTAKGSTRVSLTQGDISVTSGKNYNYHNQRYAYWLELEVPAPSGYSSTADVRHNMDGQLKEYEYDVDYGYMRIFVPVTRSTYDPKGSINQRLYIDWGGDKEILDIKGNNIPIKELTTSEENMLIEQFKEAVFTGCDGTIYTGSEAIKRLLLTDNPLGLDLRGYRSYDESDQNALAVNLYINKDSLTSKSQIQKQLVLETSRKGALYLVNTATRGEEIRDILDDDVYASELTVDTSEGSKYSTLSSRGKIALGNNIITARKNDFADSAAFKAAYDKAIDSVIKTEAALLTALNSAANPSALQKVYENPANAAYLGLAVGSEPYTAFPPAQKSGIASDAFGMLPFTDIDEARAILVDLIGVDIDPTLVVLEVSSIVLDQNNATLVIGEDLVVSGTMKLSNGQQVPIDMNNSTWTVDKTAVANVDDTGVVEAVGTGSAKVTVTSKSDGKKTASLTVKVVTAVNATGISLNKEETMIGMGRTENLVATLTPSNSTDKIEWGSEDESIAMVDEKGKVTGVDMGITNIYAMVNSTVIDTCKVIVLSDQKDILLDPYNITIGVGTEEQIKAYVGPVTTTNKKVNWTSSDITIATVDATGFVKGVSEGTAEITAESAAHPGVQAVCQVTVDDRSGVILNKSEIEMFPNGIDRITAKIVPFDGPVLWRSSDAKIARVETDPDVTGGAIITALKAGNVSIIATSASDSKATASCDVTVLSSKLTVKLNPTKYSMINDPGQSIILTPTFSPNPSNKNITWSVPVGGHVVSVDDNGIVRPLAAGEATIKGIPEADKTLSVTCTVTVTDIPVTSLTAPSAFKILLKDKVNIPYDIQPADATNKVVNWVSMDPGTLMVYPGTYPYATDADKPQIEGIKTTITTRQSITAATYKPDPANPTSGALVLDQPTKTAIVEVDNPVKLVGTSSNGKTVTILVTVAPQSGIGEVDNVNIYLDTWVFPVGHQQNLTVRFNLDQFGNPSANQPSNQKVTWTSSNSNVASVDPGTGVLKAVAPGIVTITVLSSDGSKSDSKIVVVAPKELTRIMFKYDDTVTNYGANFISVELGGDVKNVNATFEGDSTDKRLFYSIESVAPDKTTNGAIVPISINTDGQIEAKGLGIAKVIASSRQKAAYGQALPGANNVILDNAASVELGMDSDLYKINSQLTISGGAFYSPNSPTSVTSTLTELKSNTIIPLVVKNPASPVTFYVWVKPIPLSSMYLANSTTPTVNIANTPVNVYMPNNLANPATDEKMTIRANLSPVTATVDMDSIKWEITGDGADNVTVSAVRLEETKNVNGQVTALYLLADVAGGTKAGEATVKLTISSKEGKGLLESDGSGQQSVDAVTLSQSFKLQVNPRPAATITLTAPVSTSTGGAWYIGNKVDLTSSPNVISITPANASINNPALYPNMRDRIESWNSDKPNVAEVDQNGVLTFKATGSAVITAKLKSVLNENDNVAVATMTVNCQGITPGGVTTTSMPLPSSLVPPTPTQGIVPGTLPIVAGAQTSSFSSNTVSPVSEGTSLDTSLENVPDNLEDTGLVMAMSSAAASTEQKDKNGAVNASRAAQEKARAVKPLTKKTNSNTAPTGVTTRPTANVIEGDIVQLMPIVTPVLTDTSKLTWSSADPKIATVDENGIVTGITGGKSVKITAKTPSGKTAVTTVSVKRAPTKPIQSIKMKEASVSLSVGDSKLLSVTYNPSTATVKGLSWYSSDESVATVDRSGRVKAVGFGSAVITAVSDEGGKTAYCNVTVGAKVTGIKITLSATKMKVGTTQNAYYTITPATSSSVPVEWSSSNTRVVTVDSDGKITAVGAGRALVSVTAGGKKSYAQVTVSK